MGRFNAENIEQYSGKGSNSGSFFSLRQDKETAQVRFLYNDSSEIEGFTVHRVPVGDKERYVNCLRDAEDPIDKCPFCKARLAVQAKMFIPLYNEDTNEFQVWERGPKFKSTIFSYCDRYPNTVSRVFEIERNGKSGDTKTTYGIFPVGDADGTTIQDILDDLGLDALPDPIGTIILDKTAEDMEEYLDTKSFPDNSTPVRRRSSGSEDAEDTPRRARGRRDRF